jgi:hypothetical protein
MMKGLDPKEFYALMPEEFIAKIDSGNIPTFDSGDLIKLNPKYKDDIEELEHTMACGCSLCVYNALSAKYDDIKFPEGVVLCH